MIVWAMLLVVFAALFHAAWNILLQAQDDPLRLARRAAVASALAWTPVAVVAWLLGGRPPFSVTALLIATGSAVLEVVYFLFLSSAYRRGTLSDVYATARGTAPLLAVLAGVIVLGEHLAVLQVAGVVLLIGGIWSVRRPSPTGKATVAALATGVSIAAYSAADSAGVHAATPWLYGYVVWGFTAILLAGTAAFPALQAGPESEPKKTDVKVRGLNDRPVVEAVVMGMLMTSTYLIILIALRLAPLAIVSPLRESAIVLVALWGLRKAEDREHMALTLVGAVCIAAGAALVAVA